MGIRIRFFAFRQGKGLECAHLARRDDHGALLSGKRAFGRRLHRLPPRRLAAAPLRRPRRTAGGRRPAAFRRGGLRSRGVRQRRVRRPAYRRLHPVCAGRHGAAARRRKHPCRVRAGRRPQRPPAVGQAVDGAGVRGLLLHPHHRRLADRLAGIRAEAASLRLAGFARRAQRQAGFRRLLPRGHGRLRAARSGVFGGKPAGETLLRLGGSAVRGSLAVQPCGCGA